jgi:uncharacterized protein (TIGR00375 family)
VIVADLHIHSKYSYATSPALDLDDIARRAKIKGVGLLATGDFTHPLWLRELKAKLKPTETGTFAYGGVSFFLATELSCIYRRKGRCYKVHQLVFAPDFRAVDALNRRLAAYGSLAVDGRPILRLDSEELVKLALDISPDCVIVPAHVWTPHFGIFGSRSGFDSLEECFGDQARHIHALETGLSSDPAMNWRLSALDGLALISNSDAHSSASIGREANVFDLAGRDVSYPVVFDIIKKKDRRRFLCTIEFFPEEGKYHYDGHRACGVRLAPAEAIRLRNICPVCGKLLTIGVLHRVEELADRPEGARPRNAIPFKKLIPLEEIIAEALAMTRKTKAVAQEYARLIEAFGSELSVLLDVPAQDIAALVGDRIAEGVTRMRAGTVVISPGFDGEYGRVTIPFKDAAAYLRRHR